MVHFHGNIAGLNATITTIYRDDLFGYSILRDICCSKM